MTEQIKNTAIDIKNVSKDFWNRLNGNKSWIFLGAGTILQEAVKYQLLPDKKGWNFTIGICIALGTLSVGHKISKGSLNKDYK